MNKNRLFLTNPRLIKFENRVNLALDHLIGNRDRFELLLIPTTESFDATCHSCGRLSEHLYSLHLHALFLVDGRGAHNMDINPATFMCNKCFGNLALSNKLLGKSDILSKLYVSRGWAIQAIIDRDYYVKLDDCLAETNILAPDHVRRLLIAKYILCTTNQVDLWYNFFRIYLGFA